MIDHLACKENGGRNIYEKKETGRIIKIIYCFNFHLSFTFVLNFEFRTICVDEKYAENYFKIITMPHFASY